MKYVRDTKDLKGVRIGKYRFSKLKFWGWFSGKTLLNLCIRLLAIAVFLLTLLFIWYAKDLPDPNRLLARDIPQSTKIYARDNSLLYEVHGEFKRTLIPFAEMNNYVKNAAIAIEDKNFYKESGINLKGIARSTLVNIFNLRAKQGGSTITQQFVRNAILNREKTISRKIKELVLSIEINQRFSKDDILKLYLNEIPYGRNAYGIEAAAQTYFGKHAKDLGLAEAAYLAALPQAPSFYNPSGSNRKSLDARKNTVLAQMLNQSYISQAQYDQAKNQPVKFLKQRDAISAPHFVAYIQDYLSNKYGEKTLQNGGLKITTTLDRKLQGIAEQAVAEGAAINSKRYNANNAALAAMDPKTGQILAMVGSKDFFAEPTPRGCKPGLNCTFEPEVNAATAERQPGSSIKPYVYATAFKQQFGYSPATMLFDVVTNFGVYGGKNYIPEDYDGNVRGPLSIRQALAGSLNIPAVKTLALVGVENAIQTMRDFGITSPLKNCGLSLVLGGCEVRLLDHTAGFATIAAYGNRHPATGILKIENSAGNILEQYQDQPKQVLDPQSAYELISIMTDNNARTFIFGARSPLILPDREVAAKTGTTQNFHDGWTLGFTPSLAAGVWVGNNDGTLLKKGADGVIVAAPIWHNFMERALKGSAVETFPVPDGVKQVTVDSVSGKLPNLYTPTTKSEVFASFSAPKEQDNVHVVIKIDKTTNTAPTQFSDPSNVISKFYTVFHSEKPDNPDWENPVMAWAQAHGYEYPPIGTLSGAAQSPPLQGPIAPTPNPDQPAVAAGNPPDVSIVSPADSSVIAALPFILQTWVIPDTGNSITRVDLLIDGAYVQSISSPPFNFAINTPLSPGRHVFAVHAVDDKDNTADTSITLKIK